jgi:hypothetical protein
MSIFSTFGRLPTLPDRTTKHWFSNRTRLAAVAYAQIALAVVGAEGDEQDARAFVGQAPGELREFAVVADETPIGPQSVWIASIRSPPLIFHQ